MPVHRRLRLVHAGGRWWPARHLPREATHASFRRVSPAKAEIGCEDGTAAKVVRSLFNGGD